MVKVVVTLVPDKSEKRDDVVDATLANAEDWWRALIILHGILRSFGHNEHAAVINRMALNAYAVRDPN